MEFFNLDNLKELEKKLEDSEGRDILALEYEKMITLSEDFEEALVFTELFEMDIEKFEELEAQINNAFEIMESVEFAHIEMFSQKRLNRRKNADQGRRLEKLGALKKALNSFLDEFLE